MLPFAVPWKLTHFPCVKKEPMRDCSAKTHTQFFFATIDFLRTKMSILYLESCPEPLKYAIWPCLGLGIA